jgi:hypothetical protein
MNQNNELDARNTLEEDITIFASKEKIDGEAN